MVKLLVKIIFILGAAGYAQTEKLHILYSQNTNGVLVNCQCPSAPLGGMEKRATYVSDWMKKHRNTLLLDSGDLLSFDGDEKHDRTMLNAMDALNYSAVNVGDQEFSNGFDFLSSNMSKLSIPWIASNLQSTGTIPIDIPRNRILHISGLNILVMGVIDPESFAFFKRIYGDINLRAIDPEKAVIDIHKRAMSHSRVDIVVLLSNLGFDQDRELAKEIDFIDIIIGGHSQHRFTRPMVIENTIITQCGKNGQYIGHLELLFENRKLRAHSGTLIPMDLSISDDETMLKLIKE